MNAEVKPTAARHPVASRSAPVRSDYCVFRRGGKEFAISTNAAREVIHARSFTPVPQAPADLIGAFNLRGEVIPLVNLDALLEVETRAPERKDTWLLFGASDMSFAAVVDLVIEIKHIPPWEIDRPSSDERERHALIRGKMVRNQQNIIVLDGDRLVAAVMGGIAAAFERQVRGATPLQTSSSVADVSDASAPQSAAVREGVG
jgi:chemotaxis signal transduction protein